MSTLKIDNSLLGRLEKMKRDNRVFPGLIDEAMAEIRDLRSRLRYIVSTATIEENK
jgi:hypothetical protein